MLDDLNVLKQRDRDNALEVAANLYTQAAFDVTLEDSSRDESAITCVIVAGMGGSALAADTAKTLLADRLHIPFEVVKGYKLPYYVNKNTLVIASSHSGNTEETLECANNALARRAKVAIIATGGKLVELAKEHQAMRGLIPNDTQPRMAVLYNLKVLLKILSEYQIIDSELYDEMTNLGSWLKSESDKWAMDVATEYNYAKQLALIAVGKTPVIYGGSLTAPLAYKWKISWNENAKNVAFWNYLPEFNHNEFIGWTSHPIEKPFVVFDLISDLEHPQVLKRFKVSDKLLSGQRPKSNVIKLQGQTLLAQLLWGAILADFVSIYVAILNGVDPTQVDLIEKFKKELI